MPPFISNNAHRQFQLPKNFAFLNLRLLSLALVLFQLFSSQDVVAAYACVTSQRLGEGGIVLSTSTSCEYMDTGIDVARYFDASNTRWGFEAFSGGGVGSSAGRLAQEQVESSDHVTDCPVMIRTGDKTFSEEDYVSGGDMPLAFSRNYSSHRARNKVSGILGYGWKTNLDMGLTINASDYSQCYTMTNGIEYERSPKENKVGCNLYYEHYSSEELYRQRGWPHRYVHTIELVKAGEIEYFNFSPDDEKFYVKGEKNRFRRIERFSQPDAGVTNGWMLVERDGTRYLFTAAGRLMWRHNPNGLRWRYDYQHRRTVQSFAGDVGPFEMSFLSAISHSNGETLSFGWDFDAFKARLGDAYGVIESVSLPNGKTISYQYDFERLTDVVFPDGTGHYHYEYESPASNRISELHIDGRIYGQYSYESNVVQSSGIVGGVNKTYFSYSQNKTILTNAKGGVTTYQYDQKRRLTNVDHASTDVCPQVAKAIVYSDEVSNSPKIKYQYDWQGRRTAYKYNDRGELLLEYSNGVTNEYGYVHLDNVPMPTGAVAIYTGNISAVNVWDGALDPAMCGEEEECPTPKSVPSKIVKYDYVGLASPYRGRLRSRTEKALKASGADYLPERRYDYSYTFYPHPQSSVLKSISIDGPLPGSADVATTEYYLNGQIKSHVDAGGNTTAYELHADGVSYDVTDPNGLKTSFIFDAKRRLIQSTVYSTRELVTRFEYYGDDQLKKVVYPDGSYKEYHLDEARRVSHVSQPVGLTSQARELVTSYTYDLLNNVETTQNYYQSLSGSRLGGVVHLQKNTFDEFGRLILEAGQDGQSHAYKYNENGQIEWKVDAAGMRTSYTYHPNGRIATVTNPNSETVSYFYDRLGFLSKVVVGNGAVTEYKNNAFGEVEALHSPDSGTTRYEYSSAGQIAGVTKADGSVITYSYDKLGRVQNVHTSDANEAPIHYIYDKFVDKCGYGKGRLCVVVDGSGHVEYKYFRSGNLEQKVNSVDGALYTVRYTYDQFDRLHTEYYVETGIMLRFSYDDAGEMISVELKRDGGAWQSVVRVEHGADLRRQTWRFGGNGAPVSVNSYFDADGRLEKLVSDVWSKSYDYNNRDLLSSISGSQFSSLTYFYDPANQIEKQVGTPEHTRTYKYDRNGNRTSGSFGGEEQVPGSNRLKSHVYDPNGNVIRMPSGRSSTATFAYDSFGRMVKATRPSYSGEYLYNFANQRVQKVATAFGVQQKYKYLYDINGQLVAETKPNSNEIGTLYIYFQDQVIGFYRDGEIYSVINDQVGRPDIVFANRGGVPTIVWRPDNIDFDSLYRYRKTLSGDFNIGFPGQYYDGETGLWYNWHRYYDAITGRYIQSDPIGLGGGLNPYAYSLNRPVSLIDPLGLCSEESTASEIRIENGMFVDADGNPILGEDGQPVRIVVGIVVLNPMALFSMRVKPVNLPAWKTIKIDIGHIASGHMKGGTRVSTRKSMFPEGMTTSQVEKLVRQAYRYGERVKTQGDRVLVRGRDIEMWVNTKSKTIETAYPFK